MHRLAEAAYHRSPVWAQNLAVTALGYRLRRERMGPEGAALLSTLRESESWPTSKIEEYVDSQLREIVTHAFAHVPYYRRLSESTGIAASAIRSRRDLWRLPILGKEELRRDPRDFVAERQGSTKGLIKISTTGTTGTPLTVFCDVASRRRHYAFWARLRAWHGILPGMSRATFFSRVICSPDQEAPPFWRFDRFQRNYLFSSYHLYPRNLPSYCDALRHLRPDEIIGYPSSLHVIAGHILDKGLADIRPRVVFTTAETLLPYQREAIGQAFQTRVVDQYGSAEMVHFVAECDHGRHHVHPEHGILEVVRADGMPVPPGTPGEVVCTGFINRAMPLLRYRVGDRAVLSDRACACGRPFPVLAEIAGRLDDVLLTPSGRPVGRISGVFKGISGIRAAQIVQPSVDRLIVKLAVGVGFGAPEREELSRQVIKRTGSDMQVDLQIVPEIPKGPNGKFRSVISLLPERERDRGYRAPEETEGTTAS